MTQRSGAPRAVVVGLGNPILGDDGVGWRVADEVRRRVLDPRVQVDCAAVGGLGLAERLVGFDAAVVVDALVAPGRPAGEVGRASLADLPETPAGHTRCAHDTSLRDAVEMARACGAAVPASVAVVTVVTPRVEEFGEGLSAPVAAAVGRAADEVLDALAALLGPRPPCGPPGPEEVVS